MYYRLFGEPMTYAEYKEEKARIASAIRLVDALMNSIRGLDVYTISGEEYCPVQTVYKLEDIKCILEAQGKRQPW